MHLRPITTRDVTPVVHALTSAFTSDPLITYLFGPTWPSEPNAPEFFRILLDVRVALAMPALCAESHDVMLGAAMGYDTTRPAWAAEHTERWQRLLSSMNGFEARMNEYDHLADRFAPAHPHFYLGVLGVRAGNQGRGTGKALLDAFCDASSHDAQSLGVYLETASPASLAFYLKNGFTLLGEGVLGEDTELWCVFRETGPGATAAPYT